MLNAYLTSIFIWSVVFIGLVFLFGQKIKDNGWIEGVTPTSPGRTVLTYFFISSIPLLRFIMAVMLFIMATYTKEQFDTYVDKIKNEDK